jgi:alkanesulfonate monooxygenase SsuD/methylene tetrahydromethanopterin reductase-like flavin-dependent oxidoreductase (luciferase family)
VKIHTMLPGLEDAGDQARRLEALGIDGVFTFEGPRDIFVPLILAAAETSTVELMANVAIAFPRNPIQLAHQANDLQQLSHGRFTLGLGTQVRAQIEKRYGVAFDRPIARMRELIGALRAIFAAWDGDGRLRFEGEFYRHTLMTPMFNPGPNPYGVPPIFLGALGPQMTRLAAETADGLLVMPFNTRRHFEERTLAMVDEGLARSGRSPDDIELVGEVIACCRPHRGGTGRGRRGNPLASQLLRLDPVLPTRARRRGLGRSANRVERPVQAGPLGRDAAPHRAGDALPLAACGTPAEVAADIKARFGPRVDQVCLYTPYAIDPACFGELIDALR